MKGASMAAIVLASMALGQPAATPLAFEKADVSVSAPGTREEGGFLPLHKKDAANEARQSFELAWKGKEPPRLEDL